MFLRRHNATTLGVKAKLSQRVVQCTYRSKNSTLFAFKHCDFGATGVESAQLYMYCKITFIKVPVLPNPSVTAQWIDRSKFLVVVLYGEQILYKIKLQKKISDTCFE